MISMMLTMALYTEGINQSDPCHSTYETARIIMDIRQSEGSPQSARQVVRSMHLTGDLDVTSPDLTEDMLSRAWTAPVVAAGAASDRSSRNFATFYYSKCRSTQ